MNVDAPYKSYTKRVLLDGVERDCCCGQYRRTTLLVQSGFTRMLRLEDEWCEDVRDPSRGDCCTGARSVIGYRPLHVLGATTQYRADTTIPYGT